MDASGELSWRWLIDEDLDTSRVNRPAVVACRAVQDIAARLLPSFITTDYRLEITPAPPTAVAQGDRVRVQLLRRDTVPENGDLDDEDGLRFDLQDAASGYRLWMELALREPVCPRPDAHPHPLYGPAAICSSLAATSPMSPSTTSEPSCAPRCGICAAPAPRSDNIESVIQEDEKKHEQPADEAAHDSLPHRDPACLVDEPGQRLHPARQRRAARWLTTLMSEWDSQCVLATHSIAFTSPSPHARAYRLTRTDEPDDAEIGPLQPASLTPYAQLAQTVGLNRGELPTRWRALVFVEPVSAAGFEALAGEQLVQSSIRLIPLPFSVIAPHRKSRCSPISPPCRSSCSPPTPQPAK